MYRQEPEYPMPKAIGTITTSSAYIARLHKIADNPNKPKHNKAALVVEIIKVVGENKSYDFKYWLKQVGNNPPYIVFGWLKEIQNADAKYSKGAILTNRFKKRREEAKLLQGTPGTLGF